MDIQKAFKQILKTLSISLLFSSTSLLAEEYPAVESLEVSTGVYMLSAKGGNLGVLIGEDGTFLIDDQFAAGTEKIVEKIKLLGGDTPRFLINTHFHGDHSGGNENLGKAGTIIYSHDNVRQRLSVDNLIKAFNFKMPATAKAGLPLITFSSDMTFHLNNDELKAIHVPNAHTDGDVIIHFEKANVIHAGDVFFNGFFPFIDPDHGGSLKGVIEAVNVILSLSDKDTKIIPGHGPLASKADLQAYGNMLSTAYSRLKALKDKGQSPEEIIESDALNDLNGTWGKAMFDASKWISIIYPTI